MLGERKVTMILVLLTYLSNHRLKLSVDWRNWTVFESILPKTSQDPEDSCSQLINEGLVSCLEFDKFHDIPPPGISLCQNIKVHEDGKTGGFVDNSEFVVNLDSERCCFTMNS